MEKYEKILRNNNSQIRERVWQAVNPVITDEWESNGLGNGWSWLDFLFVRQQASCMSDEEFCKLILKFSSVNKIKIAFSSVDSLRTAIVKVRGIKDRSMPLDSNFAPIIEIGYKVLEGNDRLDLKKIINILKTKKVGRPKNIGASEYLALQTEGKTCLDFVTERRSSLSGEEKMVVACALAAQIISLTENLIDSFPIGGSLEVQQNWLNESTNGFINPKFKNALIQVTERY